MTWQAQSTVIANVALAMLLGGFIGFEREIYEKPAGFRTHMLVAGAAALLMSLSGIMLNTYEISIDKNMLSSDPIRIVQAIITGISFLGAGTIIRDQNKSRVQGLTTAASLLLSSSMGICIGLNLYIMGVGVTVLAIIVLAVFGKLENKITMQKGKVETDNTDG
jgi:putative Mg2+ transporter-C (MgtC) family protein